MRRGITTWHTGANAGTFFQLFGLYKYLSERGHDVKVIDYVMEDTHDMLPRGWYYYLSQPIALLKRKIQRKQGNAAYLSNTSSFMEEIRIRDKRFKEAYGQLYFTEKVSTEADLKKLNDSFDAFIVGSDQIWNASMLNRRYLLDYVADDKLKASYAPSMGSGQVLPYQRKMFKEYLQSFNYISTREKKLADILNSVLEQHVEHVLDPSMLVAKEDYLRMAHLPKQFVPNSYLLCYFMPNNEKQRKQILDFAQSHSLKIVVMAMFANSYTFKEAEIYSAAGPKEFLGLIANAAVVFTSSFHCTIFSILFNKDLYVFKQYATSKAADINQRFEEQLSTYGINRLISWEEDITDELMQPINYEQVNEIFKKRLECSHKFLNQFA